MFHTTFVPITLFIKLVDGATSRVNFRKIFKIFLKNRKEYIAETWHTYIGHCPPQMLCFFYSGRIRTLVAMAT